MLSSGHHWTGALMGVAVAGLAHHLGGVPLWEAGLVIPAGWYGGVAPDRLEIRRGSRTVIPHRTITHVFLLWILALSALLVSCALRLPWTLDWPSADWVLGGFLLGGITHILVDWPNPMGIPLWHPKKRHSLKWWRSGEHELAIAVAFSLLALGCWSL